MELISSKIGAVEFLTEGIGDLLVVEVEQPLPSTRIIEGYSVSSTPSLSPMTSATTWPFWLFIRVTPHMLENSVADPNCMLTWSSSFGDVEPDAFEQRHGTGLGGVEAGLRR